MHLALNMTAMANGGFIDVTREKMQYVIKIPYADVQEERKLRIVFPVHRNVNTAIERHPAMVCENQMHGCIPCQICTPKDAHQN